MTTDDFWIVWPLVDERPSTFVAYDEAVAEALDRTRAGAPDAYVLRPVVRAEAIDRVDADNRLTAVATDFGGSTVGIPAPEPQPPDDDVPRPWDMPGVQALSEPENLRWINPFTPWGVVYTNGLRADGSRNRTGLRFFETREAALAWIAELAAIDE